MNPSHLIEASLIPEFRNLSGPLWLVFQGDDIGQNRHPDRGQIGEYNLSDRATFLLALDVLMARKKGGSLELNADGSWVIWCGAYKYGNDLFAFKAHDPIHALKLALEATAPK